MRALSAELVTARVGVPRLQKIALADVRFHIAIMAAAKNALMQREILRLHLIQRVAQIRVVETASGAASRTEQLANDERVLAEHETIFKAIADGDVRAAKQAMELHIENLLEISLRKFEQEERERVAQTLMPSELAYHA